MGVGILFSIGKVIYGFFIEEMVHTKIKSGKKRLNGEQSMGTGTVRKNLKVWAGVK